METSTQIQQAVLRELAWDTRVTAADIGVTVDRGLVALTGVVPSDAERLAAEEAAHRVAGVLDVVNDLQVNPVDALARADAEVARAVRHALEWDALVPDERIRSTVADGWVTLEGEADFWHQSEAAERAARRMVGVRGVTNHIVVSAPTIAAEQVRWEIEDALERRADRAASRIQVSVHDGAVTLLGPVRSLAEKRAVVGAARGTPGVTAVHDHLVIDLTQA
jgi:osmotically-inducible protein OsmY